ncbi:FAD-dependent monooxygenase [Georgenia sp. Z1491]|uniref:FAD-dependent monooxygenase n=1 Tax=Georgenia sp. Z1491 TaxID=3416707 RepID=UPI003CEDD14C
MTTSSDVSVLIVGGGPVGMFLAADLGRRGVRTVVVDREERGSDQAKVMQVSVRTLEFARQLGIAKAMSTWGFPEDYPLHNLFVTSLDGYELGRAPGAPMGQPGSPGYTELSPEFQVHCPQPWLEPIIEGAAQSKDSVTILRRHEFESLTESADGVTSLVTDLKTGEQQTIRADYLISCEGFGGKVGEALNIPVDELTVDYSVDIEFECDDLLAEHALGPAVRYSLVGPQGTWATIVAVDGVRRWRLSVYAVGREAANTFDPHPAIRRAIGHDFTYEVVRQGRWKRRAAMAATFGRGRVLIAGDAAHCSPPNGGFGMNTGIADVMNLGWKIEAALAGWAGEDLLDSYGAERRPIAQITLAESLRDYDRLVGSTAYADIAADTDEAGRKRREIGDRLVEGSLKAWRPLGIHLGYSYASSGIVCTTPGTYPEFDAQDYEPKVTPGARAPHVWLSEGRSTLDLFGESFVLLRVGAPADDGGSLVEAAAAVGMPVEVVDLDGDEVASVYGRSLVLVRPDGHVAWSASEVPGDPRRIVDTVRGQLSVRNQLHDRDTVGAI